MHTETNSVFSIVTPAYNRADLIAETLESVWAQDFRPIEHVIVDDGSSDDTAAVVRAWIEALRERDGYDPDQFRVTLIEKTNGGVASARNVGLQNIGGSYVHFLDSDDLLEVGALRQLSDLFEKTGADLIFAGFRRFDEQTGEISMERMPKDQDDLVAKAMDGSLWGNAGRISLKVNFARDIGPWDESYRVFEDREYSERAVMMARNPAILQHFLVKVRTGAGPRQNDVLRSQIGREFRIRSERALADLARTRADISTSTWSAFRSRVYGLSMRSYAEGWREHGDACRQLADSICAPLSRRGRMRQAAVKGKIWACRAYLFIGRIKNHVTCILR